LTQRAFRIRLRHPPSSPLLSHSRKKTGESCACSRVFSDLRAPEKLRFGRQHLIYARFSLSSIEPVPFRSYLKTLGGPDRELIFDRALLALDMDEKANLLARYLPIGDAEQSILTFGQTSENRLRQGSADLQTLQGTGPPGPPGAISTHWPFRISTVRRSGISTGLPLELSHLPPASTM
jgi:hypothetical protein